jgi:hypothetical protein
MRLEPLYRARFATTDAWRVEVAGEHGREEHSFLLVDGRCHGRLAGTLRAANFPRRRADGVLTPDFRGAIETDDGATVLFAWHGYGLTRDAGERRLVGSVTHLAGDERYRWLNDVVGVVSGQVEARRDGGLDVELEVAELVLEPL